MSRDKSEWICLPDLNERRKRPKKWLQETQGQDWEELESKFLAEGKGVQV